MITIVFRHDGLEIYVGKYILKNNKQPTAGSPVETSVNVNYAVYMSLIVVKYMKLSPFASVILCLTAAAVGLG